MRLFRPRSMHDDLLSRWPSGDPYCVKDLLKSVSIMGATGSGKTSGSGLHFARAIIKHPNSGGLILASKPEELGFFRKIFAHAGRSGDLLVFGPEEPLRFNFLDSLGGDARNITHGLLTIAESLNGGESKGGGDDGLFWKQQAERTLYNAIEILRQAYGRVTAPEILRFVNTAATHPAQLKADDWIAGFHSQTFALAHKGEKTAVERFDRELATEFWLGEWPAMPEKLRGSVIAYVMGILHVFNSGIVRDLVSTDTSVSPAVMDQGKWVLVNMPVMELGESARFILAGWKYLTQRHVLKRHAKPGDPFTVIWADEAQTCVNSFDASYLAMCRSHLGCMVYLTQSLHSYYHALPGQAGRHAADALLTNFHIKVFHAIGDDQTAQYAASLVGKKLQSFIGGSMPPADTIYDEIMGNSKFNGSFSQHFEQSLQNSAFMSGLRTGGQANGLKVDGIVVRCGEPFSTGNNWQWVEFSQR